MDFDGGGSIDIDEFCEGLLRLKGEAKSFDVHTIIFNLNHFITRFNSWATNIEQIVTEWKMLSVPLKPVELRPSNAFAVDRSTSEPDGERTETLV